jgi:hypothetical protein
MIASHAAANGVPISLVRRVVRRESRYNPRAVGRGGAMGLMQIKYATARSMGYRGSPSGLLDANTNLTYAVKYLAGAYHAAGGNESRAQSYYQTGYYNATKRHRTTVASRHSYGTPAIAQSAPAFGNWQVASAPAPRQDRYARPAPQSLPALFDWQVANWQSAQPATAGRHRNLRYATRQAPSAFNWQVAQSTTPRRHRNLRYATGARTPQFNWRVARATSTHSYRSSYRYRYRQTRHAMRSAPTLFQSLQRMFTPPRPYRVARLNHGAAR